MNYCVNHPDAVVTSYCQNCGKGLCSACVRTFQGNIFCEQCFAARTAPPPPPGAMPPGYVPPPPAVPNPGLAAVLGFIPGVGAMYNGQYIKAIVHVLVFVVLIGMAGRYGFFGILIGFWVLYQVFDAHQTARARRDGLPLPDPFGLNELGNRIGGHTPPPPPSAMPGAAPGPNPYNEWGDQVSRQAQQWGDQVSRQAQQWGEHVGQWGEQVRQRIVNESTRAAYPSPQGPYPGPQPGPPQPWSGAPGFTAAPPPPPGAPWPPPPNYPPPPPGWVPGAVPPVPPEVELERARREPIGAIVLILLGMLFLFNTLGLFSFGWISHGWPWIIVAIAVWLLVTRSGGAGRFGFHQHPGYQPPQPPPPPASDQDQSKPAGGAQ